jgi:hypothetical protein
MWVKRTQKEFEDYKARAIARDKRVRIITAICIGLVACLGSAFFHERGWASRYPSNRVPVNDVPNRLPFALIAGMVVGSICYLTTKERRQQTVICSRCKKTKTADVQTECSCGGHFEDIDTMRWVDA